MEISAATGVRRGRASSARRVTTGLVVGAIALVSAEALVAQAPQRSAAADWPTYNRDLAGTRYSPLDHNRRTCPLGHNRRRR